jgi:hypothetical protein
MKTGTGENGFLSQTLTKFIPSPRASFRPSQAQSSTPSFDVQSSMFDVRFFPLLRFNDSVLVVFAVFLHVLRSKQIIIQPLKNLSRKGLIYKMFSTQSQ